MTSIIRNCPFYKEATEVEIAGEKVQIRPFQIILWVSIRPGVILSRRFPAILDIGHSLNFSIKEEQLRDWAGVAPDALKEIGHTTLNNRPVFLSRADLALHPNVKGRRDRLLTVEPEHLKLPEGIIVHSHGDPLSPRLPLLGLRALVHNRLNVTIDGRRLLVSIGRRLFG